MLKKVITTTAVATTAMLGVAGVAYAADPGNATHGGNTGTAGAHPTKPVIHRTGVAKPHASSLHPTSHPTTSHAATGTSTASRPVSHTSRGDEGDDYSDDNTDDGRWDDDSDHGRWDDEGDDSDHADWDDDDGDY